ncbi:MAG: YfiR family protein [Methylococcaceae bacterium]|nr:YfiR family protein [Methylococcaceae bacterium]
MAFLNRAEGMFRKLARFLPFILAVAQAEGASPSEYEVKAAFIHNFAKFVQWPMSSGSNTLRLCIVGDNPFANALEVIRDQAIDGKHWEFQFLRTPQNLDRCQVAFISVSETGKLNAIVESLGGKPVLTIGDGEGFAERGLIINFYLENQKVRFEINPNAARRAGLAISSQLLKLARIVTVGEER